MRAIFGVDKELHRKFLLMFEIFIKSMSSL